MHTHTPAHPHTRTSLQRVWPAVARRLRLFVARLRYPRARFGAGCDVRAGFHLYMGPQAEIEFGPNCILDRGMTVECEGTLRIGAGTIFGHHCTLAARDRVEIGPDCLIAEMVSIRDHDHCFDDLDVPTRDQGMNVATVRIERNVWLAGKVTVTRGVTIGENAVVGANAVVTRDLPANAVAVGIPARVLRLRGEAPAGGGDDRLP